jgi:PHD/YefM family antitoxin component YafN of YafNO toxin-antitoxin module
VVHLAYKGEYFMKFASIRDLRLKPGEVWKTLEKEKDVVLTTNGKPFAVLTRADEDSLEPTLATLRRARAQSALREIHRAAVEKGLDTVTEREIDVEIKAYRKERATKKSAKSRRTSRRREHR